MTPLFDKMQKIVDSLDVAVEGYYSAWEIYKNNKRVVVQAFISRAEFCTGEDGKDTVVLPDFLVNKKNVVAVLEHFGLEVE